MRPNARRRNGLDCCAQDDDELKSKSTIQPDARMIRAMRGIPGASFARWFKVGALRKNGRGMALIPADVCQPSRDRLFFVSQDVANEIILGCPNCHKELFRIGAKKCHNCAAMLVPTREKSLKTDWKKLSSIGVAVAALVVYLLGPRGLAVPISFFLAILGLVVNGLMLDANQVKLLYRLDPDGEFIEGRVLRLNPRAYSSSGAPTSIGRALADDLDRLGNAATVSRNRETPPKESSDEKRPSLSEAFSLGKQESR